MGDSVSVDASRMGEFVQALATAQTEVESVHADLADLLAAVDSSLGSGASAQAFRRNFADAADDARNAIARLGMDIAAHRSAISAGLEAILGADRDLGRDLSDPGSAS